MFENILVAVDGSGRSREMINMMLAMPSLSKSQITILHILPVTASADGLTEYRLAGERILEKETASIQKGGTNRVTSLLKEGDPKSVVCKVADELKPDFLVMGSRGLGRLQAILANSVSQYVFQLTSVPMLLVKDDVYIRSIRNVMVALDGSEKCLDLAIALLSGYKDGEISLLRIARKGEGAEPPNDEVMEKAIAKVKRYNIPYRVYMRSSGNQGKEICKAAEESNASLLLLGSPDHRPSIARGLPDLEHLLGKSVSDYVRVNATCPVFLLRIPGS
jgi:nucleotide-binding universal stress UspA family protein